jgi:hypothetical protein
MLFWRLTIARKSSACITCNLLFDHRRQSVVRWANLMWVWWEKSVTDWSVDSHANSILSLSLDIERILIFLNALHSTSEQTTQRLVILTSSFILSETQDSWHKMSFRGSQKVALVGYEKKMDAVQKSSQFSVMNRSLSAKGREMVRGWDSRTKEQRSEELTELIRLSKKNFFFPKYTFGTLGYFPRKNPKILAGSYEKFPNPTGNQKILAGSYEKKNRASQYFFFEN